MSESVCPFQITDGLQVTRQEKKFGLHFSVVHFDGNVREVRCGATRRTVSELFGLLAFLAEHTE